MKTPQDVCLKFSREHKLKVGFISAKSPSPQNTIFNAEIPIVVIAGDSLDSKTSLHPEGVGAHSAPQGTLAGSDRHQADDAPCFQDLVTQVGEREPLQFAHHPKAPRPYYGCPSHTVYKVCVTTRPHCCAKHPGDELYREVVLF